MPIVSAAALDEVLHHIEEWRLKQWPVAVTTVSNVEGCGGMVVGFLAELGGGLVVASKQPAFLQLWSSSFAHAKEIEIEHGPKGTRITLTFREAVLEIADFTARDKVMGHG